MPKGSREREHCLIDTGAYLSGGGNLHGTLDEIEGAGNVQRFKRSGDQRPHLFQVHFAVLGERDDAVGEGGDGLLAFGSYGADIVCGWAAI